MGVWSAAGNNELHGGVCVYSMCFNVHSSKIAQNNGLQGGGADGEIGKYGIYI